MKINDISYYLFESYKDAVEKFSQEEDKETVNQYLDSFKQLAKKGIVTGQEKDIGYWIKQGWYDFKEFVDGKSKEKTKSQTKQSKKKDTIIAHEDDEKMVVIPLTKDASCFYGKGTRWCTAATESENHFIDYFYRFNIVLFYVFMKNSGEKYASAYSFNQREFEYFDELDEDISRNQFENETGITSNQLNKFFTRNRDEIINRMDNLDVLSKEQQMEIIKNDARYIRKISNPDEELYQLIEIMNDASSIKDIKNPSEKLQLDAVKIYGRAIRYIDNPSEEVQLVAMEEDGYSIRYIDNPSEKVKIAAVNKRPEIIYLLDNPNEEIQLQAIRKKPDVIERIKTIATDKVYFEALKIKPELLKERVLIGHISDDVKLSLVKYNPHIIMYMKEPSEKLQIASVREDANALLRIKKPSETVQIEAVKKQPDIIEFINNPSEEVQLAAIRESSDALGDIKKNATEKAKKLHQELWGDE